MVDVLDVFQVIFLLPTMVNLKGYFNTPLEHTPKPLPTGYKGIPFIVGERGIAWGVL